MSKSIPGLNFMAQEQRKINPIDDAISIFLKQQKEYDEYLQKLRDEVDKGAPTRQKKKKGGKVISMGSLMDRPLYNQNPHQKNINQARSILYGRKKFNKDGKVDDRIKELEHIVKTMSEKMSYMQKINVHYDKLLINAELAAIRKFEEEHRMDDIHRQYGAKSAG